MNPPLATTYRLLKDGRWVVVPEREWWTSSVPGDIWHTDVYTSTRTLDLTDPTAFVPPRHLR